jgi:cytidylate kinase
MSSDLKIAISGKSGCGNTTVSRIVAQRLGLSLINYTFHTMAEERGMSFEEFYELAQEDRSFDIILDRKQVELARAGNCVLGSRLAVWLLEEADLRVYLDAPPEVRASRISSREGGSLEEKLRQTSRRDRRDHDRYLDLYAIDNDDFQFVDLVIDVEKLDQFQVAGTIVETVEALHRGR